MKSNDQLTDEERVALELPGPERYRFFMEHFRRSGQLWIAESEEMVLTLFDDSENELLPVWPTGRLLAETLSKEDISAGYRPVTRTFSQWQKKTTPALLREGVKVGVFPNRQQACPIVDPDIFQAHLANVHVGVALQSSDISKFKLRIRRNNKRDSSG